MAAATIFADLWNRKCKNLNADHNKIKRRIQQIEQQNKKMVELIIATDDTTLISTYETKVRKLQQEKAKLVDQTTQKSRPTNNFEETFRTTFSFLQKPPETLGFRED